MFLHSTLTLHWEKELAVITSLLENFFKHLQIEYFN